MNENDLYEEYERTVKQLLEDDVRIVEKVGAPWTWIDRALKILSFGKANSFMTGFVTTIGNTIAFPMNREVEDYANEIALLEHEYTHIKQFRKFGFGSAKLGVLPMAFVYLIFPLPMFFAWGRYRLERSAYLREMKTARDLGEKWRWRLDRAVKNLSGPNYLWAWIFDSEIREWFEHEMWLDSID